MRAMGVISRVKIKITYTAEEQQLFERVRAELLQTMPTARQHESPMTGYATVGTHPAAAVQGAILDGVLTTDTTSGSAGFEATPCGLEPGSLF